MGSRVWRSLSAAVCLAAALALSCRPVTRHVDLVITGVAVVDVESGAVQEGRTLEIDDGRILRVLDGGPDPAVSGERIEDWPGRFVIPGLWDMHVHALWDQEVAKAWLPEFTRYGVTGIRDMGGDLAVLRQVRAEGDPRWPRIVAAGPILDGPQPVDPSVSEAVADAVAARRVVEKLIAERVDFVKVYTLLPREAFLAVVEQARRGGLDVAGHVPSEVTVLEAAEAGLVSIEHLRDELGGLCAELAAAECTALEARLAVLGTHVTPTLVILEAKAVPGYVAMGPGPDLDRQPAAVAQFWRQAAQRQLERGDDYFLERQQIFSERQASVLRLSRAGVPILAGSDVGNPFIVPGVSLQRELAYLTNAGLSTRQALYSATLGAARFLGFEDLGAIEEGYAADLVLLDGNPIDSILNVQRIAGVVRAGRFLEAR